MPRVCTVCSSPHRAEIDEAVTRGESFRRVAPRYGVSDRALRRHAAEHVSAAIVKAHAVAEVTRADDLLSILREAVADARRLRAKAEKDDALDIARAVAVGARLETAGVASDRMVVVGMGHAESIAAAAGNDPAADRRVDIMVSLGGK